MLLFSSQLAEFPGKNMFSHLCHARQNAFTLSGGKVHYLKSRAALTLWTEIVLSVCARERKRCIEKECGITTVYFDAVDKIQKIKARTNCGLAQLLIKAIKH